MIQYLKTFERSANIFPGFEAEIQGLYREVDESGTIHFHTYVVQGVEPGRRLAGRRA